MEDFLHAHESAATDPTTPKKLRRQANFFLQFLRGEAELSLDYLKEISISVFLQDCGVCRTKADCKACSISMAIGVKNEVLVFHRLNWQNYKDVEFPLHWARQAYGVRLGDICAGSDYGLPAEHSGRPWGSRRIRYGNGVWIGTSQKYGREDPSRGIRNKHGKKILMLLMAEQKSRRIQIRVIGSEKVT
ncbi:hypothetical protein BV898_05233 [Hypsibius exemplaris]|uniref:Uncharacterized protein n=1 Tax=Hypsibius exemplaris TaxID=2072580 RepID=A0A1W0X0B5_HYPEX|nr:hypothetical protein BV898_05233 [Hypsibius exemplaris]